MANKHKQTIGLALCLTAFFLGGWWFGRHGQHGEVEEMYVKDGASVGIFDNIPPEDMAAAEAVATQALHEEIVLPEDKKIVRQDGTKLPSQIALTDISEIAGVAPKEPNFKDNPDVAAFKEPVSLDLTGTEVASVEPQVLPVLPAGDEDSQRTLIAAPVKYFLIQNAAEYKAFKNRARGSYPQVNFNKQMLVVLESDSNLPDNMFELISAEEKDGELVVTYRVSVLRLDKKINSHTVLLTNKSKAPVQLKQVL